MTTLIVILTICTIFNTILVFRISAMNTRMQITLLRIDDILHRPPDIILMTPKMDLPDMGEDKNKDDQDKADWWKRGGEFHET